MEVRASPQAERAKADARAAAQEARRSPWVARLGRVGFVAMGASYAIVAILALQVAVGARSGAPDRRGALHAVAREPFGKGLLILLAVGFAGFAAWRVVQAAVDRSGEGSDAQGLAKRLGYLGHAAIYGALCFTAASIVAGSSSGGGTNEKGATAMALSMRGGRVIVAAVAAGLLVAAVANAVQAVRHRFLDRMDLEGVSERTRQAVGVVGAAGHAARGVVFALIGVFLARADWDYEPRKAVGLDGALEKLAHEPAGPWLLGAVAAGLLAFAAFCCVQARYGRV